MSLGYEKIILVSGIKGKIAEGSGADYQWLGKVALAEAGIDCEPDLVVEEGHTMLGGYYAAERINLIDRKTAIFVLSISVPWA